MVLIQSIDFIFSLLFIKEVVHPIEGCLFYFNIIFDILCGCNKLMDFLFFYLLGISCPWSFSFMNMMLELVQAWTLSLEGSMVMGFFWSVILSP